MIDLLTFEKYPLIITDFSTEIYTLQSLLDTYGEKKWNSCNGGGILDPKASFKRTDEWYERLKSVVPSHISYDEVMVIIPNYIDLLRRIARGTLDD